MYIINDNFKLFTTIYCNGFFSWLTILVKKLSQLAIHCQHRFQTCNGLSLVDPTVLKQTNDYQNFDPGSKPFH